MKYLIFLLLFCSIAHAEEFKFTFIFEGQKLQYRLNSPTWTDAYMHASQFCFNFFTYREPYISEVRDQQIIDACANPVN